MWCAHCAESGRWQVKRYDRSCTYIWEGAWFRTWEAAYTYARQEAADARRARVCGVRLGWYGNLFCERSHGHYGDCALTDGA